MGVIRKKTGTRGTEGGLKYICDVCSADITSTVSIHFPAEVCVVQYFCSWCFALARKTFGAMLMVVCRFAFDVPIKVVMIMTFAFPALPRVLLRAIMIPLPTPFQ